MAKRFFTVDEVNDLIPQLEYHFQKLLKAKKDMAKTSQKLRNMGVTPQLLGKVPTQAHPEVQQLQSDVRRCYREFKQHLFAVEHMGGEIKDLELGRVDFMAQSKVGESVLLTWQLGVTDSVYMHPMSQAELKRKEVSASFSLPTGIYLQSF